MGSDFHAIVVNGPVGACAGARTASRSSVRWSRFRPDGDVCRLNARPIDRSSCPRDAAAVGAAVEAWRASDGRFGPTVSCARQARIRPGRRDPARPGRTNPRRPRSTPGCDSIEIDRVVGAITLPAGRAIDLGGIGGPGRRSRR
jgi:thiamine biosynthesis lipoprotein ApbE